MFIKALALQMVEKIDHETFRWIVSALLGVITSIGAFWLSHLTTRMDSITHEVSERNQRISVLEANVDGFNRRLDRIESKIDYLVQERTAK
jgi:uncharacterized membrane protein